jgi:hypothetical protein
MLEDRDEWPPYTVPKAYESLRLCHVSWVLTDSSWNEADAGEWDSWTPPDEGWGAWNAHVDSHPSRERPQAEWDAWVQSMQRRNPRLVVAYEVDKQVGVLCHALVLHGHSEWAEKVHQLPRVCLRHAGTLWAGVRTREGHVVPPTWEQLRRKASRKASRLGEEGEDDDEWTPAQCVHRVVRQWALRGEWPIRVPS